MKPQSFKFKHALFVLGLLFGLAHYQVWAAANGVINEKIARQDAENLRVLMQAEATLDQAAFVVVSMCAREGRSDCRVEVQPQ